MSSQQELKTLSKDLLGSDYLDLVKKGIQPPAQRFMSKNDRLYVAIWNSVSGQAVRISGIVLLKNGGKAPFSFRISPTSDRVIDETFREIPKGFLLSIIAYPEAATQKGQCFIHVAVVRERDNSNDRFDVLIQDYLQSGNAVIGPDHPIIQSTEGKGAIRHITGTNPAAGSEISETVPTNAIWLLLSINFALVTSGDVATRRVNLIIDDGSSTMIAVNGGATQDDSLTRFYTYFPSAPRETAFVVDRLLSPISQDGFLRAGSRVRTSTSNLQGADDFGAPLLTVMEWIEE